MARYIGPKCKLMRREGADLLSDQDASPAGAEAATDADAGGGYSHPADLGDLARGA